VGSIEGKIVISTRPISGDDKIVSFLENKGATVLHIPMIEISAIEYLPEMGRIGTKLSDFDIIILTSKNGVKCFFEYLVKVKLIGYINTATKFIAIGGRTAEEIRKYNITNIYVNKGNTSEDLIEDLLGQNISSKKILLPLAEMASDMLEKGLSVNNSVTRINVYKTIAVTEFDKNILNCIQNDLYEVIIFTSPSAIINFMKAIAPFNIKNQLKIACIGKITQKKAIEYNIKPIITSSVTDEVIFAYEIQQYLLMNKN